MNILHRIARGFVIAIGLLTFCRITHAQETPRPYDGTQASRDAYQRAETERRGAIARQLGTIDEMKWRAGYPAWQGETTYYRGYRGRPETFGRRNYTFNQYEPWLFVPGDIYGYRWFNPIRQPVGQRYLQTGPNRWESHPVYEDEDTLPPAPPKPEPPRRKLRRRRSSGPREF